MEEPMTDSVLVAEHPAGDRVVGQLTLNVEKTLNSLTREMVDIISDRLEAWAQDDNVVAVLIDGAGEKAFVPAVMCRRCEIPASKTRVAPVSMPSIFLLASTA